MNVNTKSSEKDSLEIPIEEINKEVISKYKTSLMLLIKNIGNKETEIEVMEDFNKLENYYSEQLKARGLMDPFDKNNSLLSLIDGTRTYLEVSNPMGIENKGYLEYLLEKANSQFKEE